ncbi:type II toxin-antitoxin system RelE family toxin [Kutzneria chonburiensis]|uniref:Type II toxin-antitoxin system RelE/ParE family toxin n=1 Tax=Kutzneria chonburiensis TaxID=1483604 RepID=A0ABV6N4D8_9PSEU|nr:type II toxin-antitoxin system RelE/ParE family toxin [Kutzneria chonburiensis]
MSETPYRVVVAPGVRRTLQRLPEKIAAACVEFIVGPLAENPQRLGKPLIGPLEGCPSARRGAYRVVYRISEPERRIDVLRVDHRADVHHV